MSFPFPVGSHPDLQHRYTLNGLLNMLDRNRRIKKAPERLQESEDLFDIIVTCEERCFDATCDGMSLPLCAAGPLADMAPDIVNKDVRTNQPVHVINVEIKDNHEDAAVGGKLILQLANKVKRSGSADPLIRFHEY